MASEGVDNTQNFAIYKDCFARQIIAYPGFVSSSEEISDLEDFTSYLASESWQTLPRSLCDATFESKSTLPDIDTLSLDALPPAIIETLTAYGLTTDAESSVEFMRKVLRAYVAEASAPPPVWSQTRSKECEICEREVPLTYHHLIPRSTHAKVLKKKMHPESMLNSVAWLCRPCHTAIHGMATNDELAREFYTVELLLEREDVRKWRSYASRQRWGVRRG
ncbi:hypothetical protein HYDPIDRAFT_172773 [Hydnomerulius pinastri MD-312]|nr:hypothetical protein HYDPIDRAFT_172773 [Hydnomerulius pinastri MD-312]